MNIYNSGKMDKYLKRALDIAIQNNLKEEMPILYRLTGFENIMENKYEEAEIILKKSIDKFNELRDRNKYILNIAAAYDFLGEVKKRENKFEEALKNYEKAISMCEENNIKQGLPIFYTHAAYVAYELNISGTSKGYIEKALNMYEKMDVIWEKASAYGIRALILSKLKNKMEALEAFAKAEAYYKLLKNPQEYDILEGIRQRINI
jgi:tetratricopeptide (TPR) repeat protein